jgi:hypothetical protein
MVSNCIEVSFLSQECTDRRISAGSQPAMNSNAVDFPPLRL